MSVLLQGLLEPSSGSESAQDRDEETGSGRPACTLSLLHYAPNSTNQYLGAGTTAVTSQAQAHPSKKVRADHLGPRESAANTGVLTPFPSSIRHPTSSSPTHPLSSFCAPRHLRCAQRGRHHAVGCVLGHTGPFPRARFDRQPRGPRCDVPV